MNFYDQAMQYLRSLEANLKRCKLSLAKSPEGSLAIHHCKNHYELYHCHNKKQKYINKSNIDFIKKLAEKAYLTNYKKFAQNEIEALQAYLDIKNPKIQTPEEYLTNNPVVSQFVVDKIFSGTPELKEWANKEYNQTGFYDESLINKTAQGHYVRSKSECIIANALYMNGIPYRYESEIIIAGKMYRPDFEIYTTKGKHVIWEHLGLLDDPKYVKRALEKIEAYISDGYIPGVNLIITADEQNGKIIDSFLVNQLIKIYLS